MTKKVFIFSATDCGPARFKVVLDTDDFLGLTVTRMAGVAVRKAMDMAAVESARDVTLVEARDYDAAKDA